MIEIAQLKALVDNFVAEKPQLLTWASLALPKTLPHEEKLRQWLQKGYQAEMSWLQRSLDLRLNPQKWQKGLNYAWVFLCKAPQALKKTAERELKISHYGQGEDYHTYFSKLLYTLAHKVSAKYSGFKFRVFCDAQPVAERELAQLAGLGWKGKNSMLINRHWGSAFFIGGIFCNVKLPGEAVPADDLCGKCTRCIDACPTQAITLDKQVDANKCISYLTIEYRGEFSSLQKESLNGWLFGCDICQEVCPWNHKHLGSDTENDFWPHKVKDWENLFIPGSGLTNRIKKTPLSRAGKKGLKRNFLSLMT